MKKFSIGQNPSSSSGTPFGENSNPQVSARRLARWHWFYEKQDAGLGSYFLDSLNSDIESLKIYAGIHAKQLRNIIVSSQNDFHLRSTIEL